MTQHLGKTRSVLPNSGPRVLNYGKGGFSVEWHPERDTHTLYHEGKPLVSKHNGFSCTNLANRILTGREDYALAQFHYCKRTGGELHVSPCAIRKLTRELGEL